MNYDCDLQAANLFERTLRGLARVVRSADSWPGCAGGGGASALASAAASAAAVPQRPRMAALAAAVALEVVAQLQAWAEPLLVRFACALLPCRLCMRQ